MKAFLPEAPKNQEIFFLSLENQLYLNISHCEFVWSSKLQGITSAGQETLSNHQRLTHFFG